MKLTFKGGKTSSCLSFDTTTKKYIKFNGLGASGFVLSTQIELRELELELVKNGYSEESYL